ncbi:hypothetical protein CC85DRAFT_285743 [Cutaneotrichosporon oleaginosum]|uniref:PARP catalytic domain-containing protein n=1 Tax=Cutaneotrichosporon oleaginosum TaxID=879819 RepID=A0A0J0XM16_9TREE|nr:uncharacterized protein CC85DRAFT_285743 [Cutaneotrichosporon oleaginosum]KLT42152.1 hypothetical protein CC85DRAFT_285743 [Cutaneotrichosporon oleaginosum]TXT11723.1 hypothetical protein COLE_02133 [Cutaneotrichosporon oleaginosum]
MTINSSDEDVYCTIEDGDDDWTAFDEDDGDYIFSDGVDISPSLLGLSSLEEDMAVAKCMLEGTGIALKHANYELVIAVPLMDLPPLQCAAYGLVSLAPIRITLQFTNGYRRTSPKPIVIVAHEDSNGHCMETSSIRVHPGFPIGLKLTQTALKFLNQRWETNRGEHFLSDLSLRLYDRLLHAGNTCMMCDEDLPFPGLKPTVCDRELCSYQLDHLGLGADLSLCDTDHKVADLLISAAAAACSDIARQSVSPIAMPFNKVTGEHYKAPELNRLLQMLPSTSILRHLGPKRVNTLKQSHPDIPFIIGWVFATNRAHIVSIPEEKQIAAMQTPHQFQIHTSTRKHAEKFEALRAKHGSTWAFHGSSMANWHNILRQNLKNASRTPMMSAGASYGEGIYLASSSATSSGYMRASSAWHNSAYGSHPLCLALVEVANSSRVHLHLNGAVIVANDENCVMLRQLFVYSGGNVPSVIAKTIAQARYKNETTIAYGSTFDEVQESGKLLVTSDEYFWDIGEVIHIVKAKNGLFINPYNNLPFAQPDVNRIINHPSGAGRELVAIEAQNLKLKQHISPEVLLRLRTVGDICMRDNSDDFATAMGAISDLNEWLKLLPSYERDALARVPFQAIDSHTRMPFRDTIMHAIELVMAGGECTHRFGDFLIQIK